MREQVHRQQIIARVVNAYLGNITQAREAYMCDAEYHAHVEFLTRAMEVFDLAMDQENIPAAIRYRVLERVMMSAPDPTEAMRRIKILSETKLNPNHWSYYINKEGRGDTCH